MVITISGESGSGKTTFAELLAKRIGAVVVSVDKIIDELYQRHLKFRRQIIGAFGQEICDGEQINKKKVGELVFSDKNKQAELWFISTPFISKAVNNAIKENDNVIVDYKFAPKLYCFSKSDYNILIVALDDKKRKELLLKRDNITKKYLNARDKNRIDYDEYPFNFTLYHNYNNELTDFAEYISTRILEDS